ncbi:MAG: hypothetical protein ACK6C0_08900 [Betaproteobacteria bacterium]|jgi:hypothetical protein
MHWQQRLILALATLALTGCASSFHGSYIVGERYFKTSIDTFPVIILSIDGTDTLQRRTLVDPGVRQVGVQAPPVPGAPNETATFTVDVKPCFTYYIVAVRANPIAAAFTPKVDFAEPLAGCTPPPAK